MSAISELRAASADGNEDIVRLCALADAAADELVGHKLFTVMRFDSDSMEVERLYSSQPQAYPPGGRKQKRDTAWGHHVLELGKPYIGSNADDIRWAFNDHDLILSLGLESVLNMPITRENSVIGTMNVLHKAGHYQVTHLDTLRSLAKHLAPKL